MTSHNILETLFFSIDDWRRTDRVISTIQQYRLEDYSIVHYDGGLDFFRDARIARRWKAAGKKIVCHYMGSDLRLRGVQRTMDELSDLNLTNESDHLNLHKDIHYLYIPFDASSYQIRTSENKRLRIVHSPSKRAMKGTSLILPIIEKLKRIRDIDFVLIENTPHNEVIRIKQGCDLAIEQIGNMGGTGYGRNSLENLAMGIPTVTEMTDDYAAWLPDNPFVLADANTLLDRLVDLIDTPQMRDGKRVHGRRWVEHYHSYESVHEQLLSLYQDHGIV